MTDTWFARMATREVKASTVKVGHDIIVEGDSLSVKEIRVVESDSDGGDSIIFEVWAHYGEEDTCYYCNADDAVVIV